jgi:signal transduction histidine kinase
LKRNQPSISAPQGAEFVKRRESVRRGVLRANRAVTAILVVAFLLGMAMVAASYRAHRSQRRAELAEDQATERLWNSYLAQARAERLGTAAGHRAAALNALSNAAAIRPSAELRNEAIAALGLRDLVREVSWHLKPDAYGFYFDPELEHYIVRYATNELCLFRLADNALVRTFRPADAGLDANTAVIEFVFSGSGRYVAAQYTTGAIVLWERETGRAAHVFGREPGSERLGWRPGFTGDDRTMCARSATRRDRVVFIDLLSGATREVAAPGVNETLRLTLRGDVFSWSRGKDLLLHDARTGALQRTISWPSQIMSYRWDWQGEQMSVWCQDGTVNVWDARTGRTRQLGGKLVAPWVQQFSPDGTLLATAGNDGTSRLWDVADARLLAQTTEARAFVFGRDGERIAFAVPGKEVGVWRISKPTGYRLLQGVVGEAATVWHQDLSADGRWAVWTPPFWVNRRGFELFDLASSRPSLFVSNAHTVRAGFHPVEPRLIVASREGLRSFQLPKPGHDPGSAGISAGHDRDRIHLNPSEPISLPQGFQPRSFSFDLTGRRAVVASVQGKMVVLDLERPGRFVPLEGALKNPDLPGPAGPTGSGALAMSPDGRWVVVGRDTADGQLTIWDAQTGQLAHHLQTEAAHVAFSPDGRWLATVGLRSCAVWSVPPVAASRESAVWQLKWQRPRAAMLSNFGAAAFTRDGSLMAFPRTVDEIELVDPATGDQIALISDPNIVAIAGLRLSADGCILTAAGSDGRTHVWDLPAIRTELAKMGLDWTHHSAPVTRHSSLVTAQFSLAPMVVGGIGLGTVSLAGLLGLVVLRRHGRLTQEFVDTTDLAAEQALELAAQRELNELKSRFVSMVSHEFRTPLGITMSAVELLRHHLDQLDTLKRQELFDDIFKSTRHMAGLMEQVLLLGRVEAGKLAFRAAPVDLEALCDRLVDESLSATNRRCPIQLKAEGPLPSARADESLLRHIFTNLLSNAVKYSPAGAPVEFAISRARANAIFTVRDRGIGIPEADLPKLFQAFHRAANVGETPGTGLGLVIVKRCVDLHGGSIEVRSKTGEGTTFTIKLPLFTG